jgi:hypothetical protein
MSFAIEVIADSTCQWTGNGIRLATREEAVAYGRDLYSRWMAVTKVREVESSDPVNYKFTASGLEAVPGEPLTIADVIRAGASS